MSTEPTGDFDEDHVFALVDVTGEQRLGDNDRDLVVRKAIERNLPGSSVIDTVTGETLWTQA